MTNLEPLCAKYGHRMIIKNNKNKIQDQENVITRALGVLMESGLYAMSIFLLSCSKKDYGKKVLTEDLRQLWQDPGVEIVKKDLKIKDGDPAGLLEEVRKVTEDLPKLILARKITEQTLTFARYHAKANVPMNHEEED